MERAIIVDIDGTLADCEHRLHFIKEQNPKDWKSFHAGVKDDKINYWCLALISGMTDMCKIIFVSGRVYESREDTCKWLFLNKIPYDLLFMREKGDYRNDDILKEEIYEKYIKDKYEILFVIDDRKRIVDMWRRKGLVCLQCAEGLF